MMYTERSLGHFHKTVPGLSMGGHQGHEAGLVDVLTAQRFIAQWHQRLSHPARSQAKGMGTITGQQCDDVRLFVYCLKGRYYVPGQRGLSLSLPGLAPPNERTETPVAGRQVVGYATEESVVPSGADLPPIGNPITPVLKYGTDDGASQCRYGADPPRTHERMIVTT